MDMKLLDSYGPIDDNLVFLNSDEYAYIAGSQVVIRPFKTSENMKNKYIK
jgi:hypothetical protein